MITPEVELPVEAAGGLGGGEDKLAGHVQLRVDLQTDGAPPVGHGLIGFVAPVLRLGLADAWPCL